ncbi:MAG: cofactor-independent phosphoglycerate mutase [Planctomycetota bacterium]
MKYAVIIPDGAGDLPLDQFEGRTALDAASTPHLDRLARSSLVGTAATTPPGFGAGSDVCSMSLLGYDPAQYHTGRAPLEAAALGLTPAPEDAVYRLNLVTVGTEGDDEGRMLDHSAGALGDHEAKQLIEALLAHWASAAPAAAESVSVTHGVSYRSILVHAGGSDLKELETTPPHEIPGEPWASHVPQGGSHGEKIAELVRSSSAVLETHPVNAARRARGERPANLAWIWGQGTAPSMPPFVSRFGKSGAMLSAVDLLRGIASCMGWDRLECDGMTSYHDTDYAGQGRATIDAFGRYDVVCCHVESPDEASHQADAATKLAAVEAIDEHVVGPIAGALESSGEPWRLLVLPDHYTLVSTRKHDATPVPFLIAGSDLPRVGGDVAPADGFCERYADRSGLVIDPGHELMDFFLRG